GTFSASNAYLSEALPRSELSQALNLTQASARLALILAPASVGFLIDWHIVPQKVYLVIAFLPVIAVLMLLPLPAKGRSKTEAATDSAVPLPRGGQMLSRGAIMAGQTGFTLAMISTFPFLVPYSMKVFGIGAGTAGWLFGLPHTVYLFTCLPLGRRLRDRDPAPWFAAGCLIVGGMLAVQAVTTSLLVFAMARVALGGGHDAWLCRAQCPDHRDDRIRQCRPDFRLVRQRRQTGDDRRQRGGRHDRGQRRDWFAVLRRRALRSVYRRHGHAAARIDRVHPLRRPQMALSL
ncbi:MAG: MFS transporter, partial [Novosphingobium sp.]